MWGHLLPITIIQYFLLSFFLHLCNIKSQGLLVNLTTLHHTIQVTCTTLKEETVSLSECDHIYHVDVYYSLGRLWLRVGASVLSSEGHWLDSHGLHVEVSLGKILKPKLLLMCWSGPCMAPTSISVCMSYCKSLWTKASDKCPKGKCSLALSKDKYFNQHPKGHYN